MQREQYEHYGYRAKMLEGCKNLTFPNAAVKIFSALNKESRAQIEALSKELA